MTIASFGRRQESQKTIATIEFTALGLCKVQNFITIGRFAAFGPKLWPKRWEVSISTGVDIDRRQESLKILLPLNSGPLICVEFQISSKLKLLQLLFKTMARYWQVSNLTGVENHKKQFSLLNSPPSLCLEYEIASKLKHLPFFVQNYGLTDGRCQIERCQYWQASKIRKNYCRHWIHRPWFVQRTKFHQNWSIYRSSSKTMAWKMTHTNIGRCQESQKTIVINEFSTFKLYTMQNFVEEG